MNTYEVYTYLNNREFGATVRFPDLDSAIKRAKVRGAKTVNHRVATDDGQVITDVQHFIDGTEVTETEFHAHLKNNLNWNA